MESLEKERAHLRRMVVWTQAAQLFSSLILGATGADLASGNTGGRRTSYIVFLVVWSVLVALQAASAVYFAWNYYQLASMTKRDAPFLKMPG
jgi:hypothetical protein